MNRASMYVGENQLLYKKRRKALLELIHTKYPDRQGVVILCGGFEMDRIPFRQESYFHYFTGIDEPGVIVTIDSEGRETIWIPRYSGKREQWVSSPYVFDDALQLQRMGMDSYAFLGESAPGYMCGLPMAVEYMQNLINSILGFIERKEALFILESHDGADGIQQRLFMQQLSQKVPDLRNSIVDITAYAASLRRCKDVYEIGAITQAIEITQLAQEAAVKALEDGIQECEIKAHIEYVFTAAGARASFPSIVASGKNATVLHYTQAAGLVRDGDLVVIDIGAEYEGYAADITRTYPISKSFTHRQRELYSLVLDVQSYIADMAKPGMWLSNKNEPTQSLNHLAHDYMKRYGYSDYFPHGIGHFLGLDVHDVGDYLIPLQSGDVITIEPGIYIEKEGIGIRIEDDYWVTERGVLCLSDDLPKHPEELCAWMENVRKLD